MNLRCNKKTIFVFLFFFGRLSSAFTTFFGHQDPRQGGDALQFQCKSHQLQNMAIGVLLGFLIVASSPDTVLATGFGPSGATMSPPREMAVGKQRKPPKTEESPPHVERKLIFGRSLNDKDASLKELSAQLDQMSEALEWIEQAQEKESLAAKLEKEKEFKRERFMDLLEAQPYWFDYTAAFIGSVVSTSIMHPLDTIKTRLQTRTQKKRNSEDEDSTSGLTQNLYQGLSGNILKEGPSSALSLSVYEVVKVALLRSTLRSGFQVYLLAGAAGELMGSIIQAPAEVVKSLLQANKAQTPAEALCLIKPRKVFLAWSAAIWRDIPFSAIQLAVFEVAKAYILNNPDLFLGVDSTTLTSEALIGAFAGGCGALLTNPTDVITARIITQEENLPLQESNKDSDKQERLLVTVEKDQRAHEHELSTCLGVVGMTKQIFNEGGMAAFFVGWYARVMYWSPAISIFLTTYCSIRHAGIKYDLFGP